MNRARLRRLEERHAGDDCRRLPPLHGCCPLSQITIIDWTEGDPEPERQPCPRCGRYGLVIRAVRPADGWGAEIPGG